MNEKDKIKEEEKTKKREHPKNDDFEELPTPKKKRKLSKNEQKTSTLTKV